MLALIQRVLTVVLSILADVGIVAGLIQALNNVLQPQQGGSTWLQVSNELAAVLTNQEQPTIGILARLAALQAAVAALPHLGDPVTLPPVPPPAYTPPSLSDIGATVWAYPSPESGQAANDRLDNASFLGVNLGNAAVAIPTRYGQYLYLYGTWWGDNPPSLGSAPDIDPRTITAGMTLTHDWLNSVYGGLSWFWNPDGSSYADTGDGVWWWYVPLTDVDFLALKARVLGGGSGATLPPIWPGLAGVTLGSPVPLVDGLNLAGPMAGVLVEVATALPRLVFTLFGPHQSYRYLGQLAFASDNDDLELFQQINWDSGVYLPSSLAVAERVVFHVSAGVAGTVTPFTIP